MGKINLLDELTINKIAAGEVIERPASVIKEMVENSIDAGATNITVEIRNGGISFIKITDNGKGIAPDDIEMAFERHATSKIRSAEDLDTVTSMGFRGEALPSIAAISNVELCSKTEEQQVGYRLVIEGGKVLEKGETACQKGTTIIVKDLFFNTPVRYKFLKKDFTESGYIEDIVTRIALVHPEIAIKLVNTGKTIISTAGNGNLKDVIYNIYGKDIAFNTLNVNYNYDDIKITGVVGRPEISRSNRSNQIFFVNSRYIKDKVLLSATENAYKNLNDYGKYAFVILNIQMPPRDVDVNVHPAKLEVRFADENKIYKAVFHAIEDTLEKDENTEINDNKKEDSIPTGSSNIIADLYYKKNNYYNMFENNDEEKNNKDENEFTDNIKVSDEEENKAEISSFKSNNESLFNINKVEENNKQDENDLVNTSDVLEELKSIKNTFAKENEPSPSLNNEIKPEKKEEENENNLPDGSSYTYEGENKYKIESLLRQLHPEKKAFENYTSSLSLKNTLGDEKRYEDIKKEYTIGDNSVSSVAEDTMNYKKVNDEENKVVDIKTTYNVTETLDTEDKTKEDKLKGISQKFDLIRQNLERLDSMDSLVKKNQEETKIEEKKETTDSIGEDTETAINENAGSETVTNTENENSNVINFFADNDENKNTDISDASANVEKITEEISNNQQPENTIKADIASTETNTENNKATLSIFNQNDEASDGVKIIIQNDDDPDVTPWYSNMQETKKIDTPSESIAGFDDTRKIKFDEIQEAIKSEDNRVQQQYEKKEEVYTASDILKKQYIDGIQETETTEAPKTPTQNESSDKSNNFDSMYEKLFGTKVIKEEKTADKQKEEIDPKVDATDIVTENVSLFDGIETFNKKNFKFIGLVFDSYIVVEIENEMFIINHRLAREKLIYDVFKSEFYNGKEVGSQMLLLPDIIDIDAKGLAIVRENANLLRKAGFIFEEFGDDTIKLSGVPEICLQLNTKELFYQIVSAINTVPRTDEDSKISVLVEVIAERIVQKEDFENTEQEINALMEALLKQKDPFNYSFNKQVALKMTKYDIERKFSRK